MESICFAILLFCIILVSLCWLVTPATQEITEDAAPITEVPTDGQATDKLITKELVLETDAEPSINLGEVSREKEHTTLKVAEEPAAEPETPDEETAPKSIEEVQEVVENEHPKIDILALKIHKLNKKSCVKISDLPTWLEIPSDVKLYRSKGNMFIKLQDLEQIQ